MTLDAPQSLSIHRGQRRFRIPIEGRFYQYTRPDLIRAVCVRCGANFDFIPTLRPGSVYDPESGGWSMRKGEIEGEIQGRGACKKCGAIMEHIHWPNHAYFSVKVPEGIVWAWSQHHIPALLARVTGDRVLLRQLTMYDVNLTRFVDRLPRYALQKKNRYRIERGMKQLLEKG